MALNKQIPEISYYLKERKDKYDRQEIYLCCNYLNTRIRKSTGLKVLATEWDNKNQNVLSVNRDSSNINRRLLERKNKIISAFLDYNDRLTPMVIRCIMDDKPTEKREDGIRFITYCRQYDKMLYDSQKIAYKTYMGKESCITVFEKFLRHQMHCPDITLSEISLELVDKFIVYRKTVLENKSFQGINKALVPIYRPIQYAMECGLIKPEKAIPIIKDYLPTKITIHVDRENEEGKIRFLTRNQMDSLLEAYDKCKNKRTKEFLDVFFFSYSACGLRFSDIITLEWKHIDFEKRSLKKIQFKSAERVVIPLNMMAMAILDKWRKLNRNSRFVFDFLEENFDLRDEPKLQRRKDSVNHTINVSLKSVGYKIGLDFALTMHVARHTYAVLAINNGMDRKMLSTTMGHSSTVITEKVYATVLSESIEEEMSKMQMLYKDIDIDRFEK